MEAIDGEKSGQAAAQITAAWNGPAYDVLAGVCFYSGRARPFQGAANVASESLWWMRARQAGGVPEEASARAMTAGLAFPIVYPPAHRRARTAECPWHFQDELKDKIR